LIIAAFLLSFDTRAQVNFPFPDSAAVWVQSYCTIPNTPWPPLPPVICTTESISSICMNGSDTLIGGITYKQVELCNMAYLGAIKEDSSRVFFLPKDSIDAFLLYDFNVTVGDTLSDVFVDGGLAFSGVSQFPQLVEYIVTQVDTIEGRKEITLGQQWGGPEQVWIEGFGSPYGLFSRQDPINVSGYLAGIDCMSHLDTIWFFLPGDIQATVGNCTPQYLGVTDILEQSILCYPNPASDELNFSLPTSVISAALCDLQGRNTGVMIPTTSENISVNIGHLPDGVYVLKVRSRHNVHSIRLVKSAGDE